jgi:hypothetical protein
MTAGRVTEIERVETDDERSSERAKAESEGAESTFFKS